jgi:glycosyltransferase involved in cell wall biosynthesis
MRITLINQTFYPDVVSSGQHLVDLAVRLAEAGHEVTVITSRRAYDNPKKVFAKNETWRRIRIQRLFNTGFGKGAKWRRAADFATFMCSCAWRLCLLPKQDLVLAMTSPPLISFLTAAYARLRGIKFCYWIMDLNPDEALAAGWLQPDSFAARWLERCSRFSLRQAARIIVLDQFMNERICRKGIAPEKISVIPPWSHDSEVNFDLGGRLAFRKANGLENKFVVMYSGNHSPCHPLDTVLAAAKALAGEKEIAFCFVGGGSEFARVKKFAFEQRLANITCLPYQPLATLAGSLSAADLHLVVMGNPYVGLVHPCKIYNIMRIGTPLLYVGPRPSHISEILDELDGKLCSASVGHGEVEQVLRHILEMRKAAFRPDREGPAPLGGRFSIGALLPPLVHALESTAGDKVTVKKTYPRCSEI